MQIECPVPRAMTAVDMAAGAAVVVGLAGVTAAMGGGWLDPGIAVVVGLVLGHVPALLRGGGLVRLWVDEREVGWQRVEGARVVDEKRLALEAVAQVLVLPNEGAGWGIEIHERSADDWVHLWSPQLPLRSQGHAQQLASTILERAPHAVPEPDRVDEGRARPW